MAGNLTEGIVSHHPTDTPTFRLKVLGEAAVDVNYVPADATFLISVLDVSIARLLEPTREKL